MFSISYLSRKLLSENKEYTGYDKEARGETDIYGYQRARKIGKPAEQ